MNLIKPSNEDIYWCPFLATQDRVGRVRCTKVTEIKKRCLVHQNKVKLERSFHRVRRANLTDISEGRQTV